MRYPEVLYETPWEWAVTREAFWFSATGLRHIIRDLRRNLGWEVSSRECREWRHKGGGVYICGADEVRLRWDPSRRAWMPQ
jgi:hypothetical protein